MNDGSESERDGAMRRSATVDKGNEHLVLINGAAAVALLAFLQAVWGKSDDLSVIVLLPILLFAFGTGTAGILHLFRYECSLRCEQHRQEPGRKELEKKAKRSIRWSERIQRLPVELFMSGAAAFTVGVALALYKASLFVAIIAEILVAIIIAIIIWLVLRRFLPPEQ